MFKSYLKTKPKGFQLGTFLIIFVGCFLIAAISQQILFKFVFPGLSIEAVQSDAGLISAHPNYLIFSNALFSLFAFGLPSFLFAYLADPFPAGYLGLRKEPVKKYLVIALILALGMVPVLSTLGGWIKEINLGGMAESLQEARDNQLNAYLSATGGWGLIRNIIFLALVPAFFEELFFRGIIQKFAFSYFKSAKWAILTSAICFGLAHLSFSEFIPIFLAGVFLGIIYHFTQSLWLNVIAHATFNGLQVILVFFQLEDNSTSEITTSDSNWLVWTLMGAGLILLVVGLRWLRKTKQSFPDNWGVEDFIMSNKENEI